MKFLGEILLELKVLSEEALEEGLRFQEEKGGLIGEILVRKKSLSESDLLKALGIQYHLEYQPAISVNDLNTEFTEKIPIQYLKKYCMIPVITNDSRKIAINNPVDFQPLDDLKIQLDIKDAEPFLAPKAEILSSINFIYDSSRDSAEQVLQDMHDENGDSIISVMEEAGDLLDDTSDAPIIKLVNVMLSQAVKD
ncbi:MAG: type II secretion system protein GspE, partial [Desulfobacteraceae bacterium]